MVPLIIVSIQALKQKSSFEMSHLCPMLVCQYNILFVESAVSCIPDSVGPVSSVAQQMRLCVFFILVFFSVPALTHGFQIL